MIRIEDLLRIGESLLKEIDDVDIRIMGFLLEDARRNFAEIGEELGLSKNAVWNRYRKMTKLGVLVGATIQINYKRLGYDAVGTLLLDVEPSQIEQVSRYIKAKVPDVFGPFLSASRYNLRAVVTLKSISELGKLKDELRKKSAVSEINSTLWTDVWFMPEKLSLIPVRQIQPTNAKSASDEVFNADEVDLQVIRELAMNSRVSFRTLAKQLKTSTSTLTRRYERLKQQSILVPRIQINPVKIGYSALANFFLRVMPQQDVDTVIRKIFSIPDVFYVMKCSGDFNIGVMLMVKDIQEMLETSEHITRIRGVKTAETTISAISKEWPLSRTYTSTLGSILA